MKSLALVLVIGVGFASAASIATTAIPDPNCEPYHDENLASVTFNPGTPHPNTESLLFAEHLEYPDLTRVFGTFHQHPQGCYYGLVYDAPTEKSSDLCHSGPVIKKYDAFYQKEVPLLLFDTETDAENNHMVEYLAETVSVGVSSKHSILDHTVKVYQRDCENDLLDLEKVGNEPPVACGVVNEASLPPTYVEGFHDFEAVKAMEYRALGKTGLLVSKLSFGGGPLGCHYGSFDETEAIETIRQAIRQGVNYIDTAPWYGQGRSEAVIGKALKGIPRGAYYIATKVGRYELDFDRMFDFDVEKTRKSLKKSLELLQLDYVDVIQVHDIEFAPSLEIILTRTLPELSRQVRDGKARYIGITGYPVSILKECIEKSNITISCVLTYTRYTLIDETLLDYVEFFKKNNIGIINAAGVGMAILTNCGPPDWHPASEEVKNECENARQCCKDHDENLARLAIWYSMQCEYVATNLIGMQNMKDLKCNLDVMLNGITDKEKEFLRHLREKYFDKIKGCHWEGREIEAYRKATNRQ